MGRDIVAEPTGGGPSGQSQNRVQAWPVPPDRASLVAREPDLGRRYHGCVVRPSLSAGFTSG